MRTHLLSTSLTATFVVAALLTPGLAPSRAFAQVVEQTIRVVPDAGGGGVPLPFGAAGQRQFKSGSGRIRGRVLANDAAVPIRRAQVRITGQDIAPKAVLTDADGRFEFRDLPAGRFTLQGSKTGFVTVQYGQTRPFEQGKTIELADKQALDNANIAMPRGGVISGRIVDEFGDVVPDASVTAMRLTWTNGRRRLVPSPGRIAQTNDLGQFRIFGLPPGDYYVSASLRAGNSPLLDMELGMANAMFTTGVLGAPASEQRSGYASTYYPGTPNAADAQRIALGAGQELAGADFPLLPVRLARVTGLVVGSDGKPVEGAAVLLVPSQRDLAGLLAPATSRTAKDGSFTLGSVPPGDYTLQARSVQTITSTQGDSIMVFRATAIGAGGGDAEFGSTPVSIGGDDIQNLILVTSRGATATGRVVFDGSAPTSLSAFRVSSVGVDPEGPAPGGPAVSLKEDGAFELKGLAGPRLMRVASPPGWTVKSVKLNGIDITDTGTEFKPGDSVGGLEIELTQRISSVGGTVSGADGSPLKDYTVVVFAESPELWRMPMSRWVHAARPDQEGRFRVPNLPAGAYLAVAVEYVPQGEWGDPDLLDRLRSKGKRFTLSDGSSHTLDLRLTGEY